MISIVFAVPYPAMREAVLEVFESHPKRETFSRSVKVVQAEKLDIAALRGSIIVARGMTFHRIRSQFPGLPCVEVIVHTSDIIDGLLRCREEHRPRRIALIGHFPHLPPPEALHRLTGCSVAYYPQDSVRTLSRQIKRALDEGADAFVGGYSLCLWAEANGHPSAIVTSGPESIRNALDEAIRTYSILQENEISRLTLENTREAVVYADQAGLVNFLNPAARRLLAKLGLGGRAETLPLRQALPFLAVRPENSEAERLSFDDELFEWKGTQLTVSAAAAFVGDAAAGTVVTINTVESIQRQEYRIRERLSEKGLRARYTFRNILCGPGPMDQVIARAKKCALADANCMLIGETGTGKELFAQSIHNHSGRKDGPFLAVNCAALPEHLIESELFGYSEGAFTGARRGGKPGLIETAHGGTLFLDEISELPLTVQGTLLRVLQEREVRRVGGDTVATVDVRVIAASNIPLHDVVSAGRFRRDLLYRLDILSLFIPPLRERPGDILILFRHCLRQHAAGGGAAVRTLSREAEALLLAHPFEGNVRELRNIAERLSVLCEEEKVSGEAMRECLQHGAPGRAACGRPESNTAAGGGMLRKGEEALLREALTRAGGNRTRAAALLGIDRSTLWRKMRRLGLEEY